MSIRSVYCYARCQFFAELLDLTAHSFCGLSLDIRHSLAVSPNNSIAKKLLMLASQGHWAILIHLVKVLGDVFLWGVFLPSGHGAAFVCGLRRAR